MIDAGRSDAHTLDSETFKGVFEDKYYLITYYEAKRDEFLRLVQGSLLVVESERKYIELLWYVEVIVASKLTDVEDLRKVYERRFILLLHL